MRKAMDVANFFLYLFKDDEEKLTNLKLNKLLYYAQGHALKETGKPLFDDKIEAWQYGPVVSSIYHAYKSNGSEAIKVNLENHSLPTLSDKEEELLLNVAREYGQFTGSTLTGKTHRPGTPWSRVFKQDEKYVEIPISLIQDYFIKYEEIKPLEFRLEEDDFIGYRDEDGILVLPVDFDDENS